MGPNEGSRMSDLTAQNEDAAQAAFRVTGKCLAANSSLEGLTHLDPERRQFERAISPMFHFCSQLYTRASPFPCGL